MRKKQIKIKSVILLTILVIVAAACVSSPRSNIVEMENKGTAMELQTPDWVRLYIERGLSAVQALSQYRDVYCIIGEERGTNRQFVLAWADMASAQQRIGSLVRTSIASRYEAAVTGSSQLGAYDPTVYRQEIDNVLTAIVNVSYSGAKYEADWWSYRRRYDPDNREEYTDEYVAWVLYTIPKAELNLQTALAMETSLSRDSALYDVTIALARDILLQGYDENEVQTAAAIRSTAADYYNPPGSITAQALEEINLADEYLLGRNVAGSILTNYEILDTNSALTLYLNQIAQALVINSPQPAAFDGYYVAILDSDEVNAFASPGGHILVTRGLVSAAKSEDSLAAVIAHEIAHIQLHHGVRAIQTNRDIEDWLNQFNFSGAQIIADKLNAGFSQTQEFDADIYALSILTAAGYNPQGLLETLQELGRQQGGSSGGFNDTHPSPQSRLVNAEIAANRYTNITDNSRFRQRRFNSLR